MTDKELIKQEIERIIEEETPISKGSDYYHGAKESMEKLLQFINSLPEEPASEDLEEASIAYSCANPSERSNGVYDQTDIEWAFEAGAEWQKEKDYKMYAHVPLKDIHDAWQDLKKNKPDIEKYPAVCFQKGADWRENQMKEALQTEYEKGRFDMREEMMKDSVEAEVMYPASSSTLQIRYKLPKNTKLKYGDKVKIIILKTE